jgi:hypothetical protein
MSGADWIEGDERAAWELAESYVDDVPTASTNPACRSPWPGEEHPPLR